ncbi:MAG TPA: hypothetical protein GYA04_01075, partial [Acholeplasma sp.]|nr:hypothetical protein [Acholeplasma sp.]
MINQVKVELKKLLENKLNISGIVVETPKKGQSDLSIPLFGFVKLLGLPMMDVY